MHNPLAIAVLAGLGGMFGWGFADFCAKKTIDSIGAIKSLVWAHAFGTTLFIGIAVIRALVSTHALAFPDSASSWLGVTFFGALQMVVYWLAYEGFGKGQLAVLNPVFASYSGLVAIAAVVFYGEKLSTALAVALVLIFCGIILLNIDMEGLRSKRLNIAPGLAEVGAAALLAAIWTVGWNRFIGGRDALPYALCMYAAMTIAALVLAVLLKVSLPKLPKGILKYLVLIGAGETLAYLAISWGYSATSLTGVVALISGAFSLPTVVLAYVFLKERISRLQTAAIALTIVGVVLVALQ